MVVIMPYLAILITIGTGWAIVKRYNAHMVLLFSGLILICLSVLGGVSALLPGGTKSTGFVLFVCENLPLGGRF